jgi:hypothetical protein
LVARLQAAVANEEPAVRPKAAAKRCAVAANIAATASKKKEANNGRRSEGEKKNKLVYCMHGSAKNRRKIEKAADAAFAACQKQDELENERHDREADEFNAKQQRQP